ncbi:hypothetical protein K435DRAFT_923564 [Dendrothele bispora CBS 962.96]|uniref:DUF6534 domain-containing protein n=1 Tax=Dendrothele bispora (strain CBS 962.96) TaxID=1314807 RepID=A0A4S8LBF6_DENBC|nr:hypothetical protein K435DRAFT_923564 [Dendrothele bispora CBS 962.96]
MLNLFLLGMILVQSYIYLKHYKNDRLWTKIFVSVLVITNFLNTIFLSVYLYTTLVLKFTDVAYLSRANWLFATDPVMTGIIAAYVQLFFVWRIKVLTGNYFTALATLIPALAGLVGSIVSSVMIKTFPLYSEFIKFKAWVIVWLIGETVADLMITSVLVAYLRHKTGFRGSGELIDRIIRSTVQTGLVTSTFAVIDLVLFLAFPERGLHLIFNVPLGKLYSIMLMSSLNSREGWAYNSSAQIPSKSAKHGGALAFGRGNGGPPAPLVVHVDAHEMTVIDRGDSEADLHNGSVGYMEGDKKMTR